MGRYEIQLGGLWDTLETRMGMFMMADGQFVVRRGEYLEAREKTGPYSDITNPAGIQERRELREFLRNKGILYNDPRSLAPLIMEAINYKRAGNLSGAYALYVVVLSAEELYSREHIRGLARLFLLAKNFEDAEKVFRYMHAFSVRLNKFKSKEGVPLDHAWGIYPFLDFLDYSPKKVLEVTSGGWTFNSKSEVEEAVRAYGGSSYWSNYSLSYSEYDEFVQAFGR